jgi:hypothetical protein
MDYNQKLFALEYAFKKTERLLIYPKEYYIERGCLTEEEYAEWEQAYNKGISKYVSPLN